MKAKTRVADNALEPEWDAVGDYTILQHVQAVDSVRGNRAKKQSCRNSDYQYIRWQKFSECLTCIVNSTADIAVN